MKCAVVYTGTKVIFKLTVAYTFCAQNVFLAVLHIFNAREISVTYIYVGCCTDMLVTLSGP